METAIQDFVAGGWRAWGRRVGVIRLLIHSGGYLDGVVV